MPYNAERKVKFARSPNILEIYLYKDLGPPNSKSYFTRVVTASNCGIKQTKMVTLVTDEMLFDGSATLVTVLGISAQACSNCPARPGYEGNRFSIGKETCKAYAKLS